jgi:hypothetical protein
MKDLKPAGFMPVLKLERAHEPAQPAQDRPDFERLNFDHVLPNVAAQDRCSLAIPDASGHANASRPVAAAPFAPAVERFNPADGQESEVSDNGEYWLMHIGRLTYPWKFCRPLAPKLAEGWQKWTADEPLPFWDLREQLFDIAFIGLDGKEMRRECQTTDAAMWRDGFILEYRLSK